MPSIQPNGAPSVVPSTLPSVIPTVMLSGSPSKEPSTSPSTIPSSTPSVSPSIQPSTVPSFVPTVTHSGDPSIEPSTKPSIQPTAIPSVKPSTLPSDAPTTDPGTMESVILSSVGDAWTTVGLTRTYISAVPVCTVKYDTGTSMLPAVVRMRNIDSTSFQIRLQNPAGNSLSARAVHCLVVEEGSWVLPDGRKLEAQLQLSTVTDSQSSWVGEPQAYLNTYSAPPVVLGQITSYNDANWSVFWSCGASGRLSLPSQMFLRIGKHVGGDVNTSRVNEMIGLIVIEAKHATSGGIEIETARGERFVRDYIGGGSYIYTFDQPFTARSPAVTIVSQVGMLGPEGSWAVTKGAPSSFFMSVAVDEDAIGDPDRNHVGAADDSSDSDDEEDGDEDSDDSSHQETLDYIALSAVGSVVLSPAE